MAAIDNYNLANNPEFRNKVASIMRKAALSIIGETGLPDIVISKRGNEAAKMLADNDRKVEYKYCLAITSLGTLTEASLDSDIEFMINSVISDLATVSAEDMKDYLANTTRILTYKEAELLVSFADFVKMVQSSILKKALYFKDLYGASDWETLTDLQKKQYNFGVNVIEAGTIDNVFEDINSIGTARVFLMLLIRNSVGVKIPVDGFEVEKVTGDMVLDGIFDGISIDQTYDSILKDVDITEKQ